MRYRSIFLLLFLAVAVSGFSASLEELIGAGLIEELASSNPFTQVQHKDIDPQLMPRNSRLRSIISGVTETLEPTLLVESIYRYQKPAGAAPGSWTEAERTRLYNICLSISSLAGIEYFSASRNRMRVFYETSTVIDGPETKRPLRDPFYGVPPAELSLCVRQKDLTFGDNIYRYDYHANPESLIFVIENLTNLTVGPITVMRQNLLRSVVAVLDAGDSILVYMASMTKTVSFPGIAGRAGRSFSNRAEAILSWFARRADEAF